MGLDNLKPLDELRRLDQQIESVSELSGLKPIFFRLEEIAKANVNDFDVQLAVGDIKQHLVNRGTKLKEMKDAKPAAVPRPSVIAPPPPAAPPTVAAPPPAVPPPPPIAPPPGPPQAPPAPVVSAPPVAPPPPPMPTQSTPMPTQGPWATTESAPPTIPPQSASGGGMPLTIQSRVAAPPPKPPSKPPEKPAAKQPRPPSGVPKPVLIGAAIGLVFVIGIVAFIVHKRRLSNAVPSAIAVQIATTPPGATVKVGGEAQCTSNCSIDLAPGNYQITAFLDGYEPAASGIVVAPGQPVSVNLTLEPQAQSLRIITDLDQGQVVLDGDPPADLQQGQFVLDRVLPGTHTVKVTGKGGEADFTFQVADAKQPSITGPVTAKNLDAVLVASMGNQAHVQISGTPSKLAVNGQPEADTNPAGVDLKNFQAGVDELVIGDGKDQHSVKENFGPAPMITAFLKSDLNEGTLVVSTAEDDVRVFINNREQPRRTQRGQLRIPTIGQVSVQSDEGRIRLAAAQTAMVKKGAETRLEFKLTPSAQFSILRINGGTPGAEVLIDQRSLGTIGQDGSFSNGTIPPGDHIIDIRKDGFGPHRVPRNFRVGEAVTINGGDAVLTANPTPPPPPTVTKKAEPAAPPPPKAAPPPPPKVGTMADWVEPAAWKMENGVYLNQVKGFIPYKLPPKGVFTFTVELVKGGSFLHGGRVRWYLNYIDAKNYAQFEMDNKNFWAKVVSKGGKAQERTHTQIKDLGNQKSFTIEIDVTPEHIVHKLMVGGEWMTLDSWAETGHNFSEGKFGFFIQGNDEIGLTDFKFQPK